MSLPDIERTKEYALDRSQINWQKVGKRFHRIRKRIYLVSLEGRWKDIKSLQHLLVRSRCAKLPAIRNFSEQIAEKFCLKLSAGTNDASNTIKSVFATAIILTVSIAV
ncbi:MAG: reverse transcriptase N-terminal domain-containing protein [Promethearchaeia archaeon]